MDRDKFFNEVRRSLKPNCWLVAYDNYFLGEIENEPSFRDWFREGFLKTFPTTPRNRLPFETDSKDPDELVLVHEERHRNLISLTQRELTDYFLTITNVINVIEKGEKSLTEARSWMLSQTDGFFSLEDSRDFSFSAPIWYFRRLSEL